MPASFPLALNTSTIKQCDILTAIEIAGKAGFEGIELWNDDVYRYLEAGGTIKELKQRLADAGLRVPSMIALHGWMDSQGDAYQKALDEIRRRMDQAAALGAPYIVASPARGMIDVGLVTERYAQLLELGRQHGVKPALEFLGFVQHVNNVPLAWEIASGTGDADATVVMDTFHIFRGGHPLSSFSVVPADRIAIFHVNDAPAYPEREKQTDADRVYPGDGILPLQETMRALREHGYTGFLSLELFNRTYWEQDPAEVAATGFAKCQPLVKA